jgi:DNA polymerase III subunit epsilon
VSWHLGPMTAFDVESSGLDLENARVVTAVTAAIRPGSETVVASHLIAVDVDIPAEATAVHGITTEQARAEGKPAAEALEAIAAALAESMAAGIPVVGANLCYDFTVLDRELRRNGLATLDDRLGRPIGPVVDVFVIDKHLDRFRPGSRKLEALCQEYGVKLDGAHNAEFDALAAARVAWRIGQRSQMDAGALTGLYAGRRYPGKIAQGLRQFGRLTLEQLHDAQVDWYAEQAEGLAAFWRQKANELDHTAQTTDDPAEQEAAIADAAKLRADADGVTTDWPVRPFGGNA